MTSWMHWRIALPLIGLSSIVLVAAAYGATTWWSDISPGEQVLTMIICLLLAASLVVSIGIGTHPRGRDIPWTRIGVIVAAQLLACLATILRSSLS